MITDTRIGIGIVHCQSAPGSTDIGYTPVFKSDNGKWSSIIDDTGTVFRHVKIDYDTIMRMIHFAKDGEGWYMCSMKPIPGRDEEYRASWVYFPASLELTKKEIKSIIEVAESQIKQKEYDESILQDVIHKYQKVNLDNPLYNIPSTQHGFAFRDTSGNINISDLYENIYQKEFTQYEWVLLMDKSLVSFKGDSVVDISDREILESYIIKPLQNEFGFTPYRNGEEFRSPVRIMEGDQITVEFKKSGYLPITKSVRTQADFTISAQECKKYFKKSQFVAYDSKNNKHIPTAFIKPINATESEDRLYWIFAERDLGSAKFDVKADGYITDNFDFDLREMSLYEEKRMSLEPEAHEYLFILPLDKSIVKDEDSVEVIVHSQYVIRDSPFKGYRCAGTPREGGVPNRLTASSQSMTYTPPNSGGKFDNKGKRGNNTGDFDEDYFRSGKQSQECPNQENTKENPIWKYVKNIGCGIAVLAFIVFLGLFVYNEFISDEPIVDGGIPGGYSPGGNIDDSDAKWNTAYGYLKKHTSQIHRGDMESFDNLKGLYEIVNGYRFKDYVDFIDKHPHRDDILAIDEWKRLYEKAKEIGTNKKGVYNREGEEQSITFENYLKKDFSQLEDMYPAQVNGQEGERQSHSNSTNSSHQDKEGEKNQRQESTVGESNQQTSVKYL